MTSGRADWRGRNRRGRSTGRRAALRPRWWSGRPRGPPGPPPGQETRREGALPRRQPGQGAAIGTASRGYGAPFTASPAQTASNLGEVQNPPSISTAIDVPDPPAMLDKTRCNFESLTRMNGGLVQSWRTLFPKMCKELSRDAAGGGALRSWSGLQGGRAAA